MLFILLNAVSSCPIKEEDVKMLIVLFFNISVCLKSFTSWILGERKLVIGTWAHFTFVSEACSPAGILGCSWTIPFYLLCAVLSCFSLVPLFVTPWTTACQAPLSWDTPDRNTAVGCHALQGIFPTQGSNLRLLVSCFAGGFFTTRATWEAHRFIWDPSNPRIWSTFFLG